MHDKPLVSVIIIFLNEERYLREAIESVFVQTYDNWEMLLVDDGSTDDSSKIARDYSEKYPDRIKYLEHQSHANLGMSASRNLGIGNATGKYISHLDGDDVWLENKLERQVAILDQNPEAVMVYGPVQLWYSWTGEQDDKDRDFQYGLHVNNFTLPGNRLYQPPELLALFLRHKQLIPTGIMIQREVIEEVDGYEEQFRGNYEDAVLISKVCLKSPVFVSEECWYRYRQHPQSYTKVSRKAGKSDASQLEFLNWVEKYLSHEKVKNRSVWKALKAARRQLQYPRMHRWSSRCRCYLGSIKRKVI